MSSQLCIEEGYDTVTRKKVILSFRLLSALVLAIMLGFSEGGILFTSAGFKVVTAHLLTSAVLAAAPARCFKSLTLGGVVFVVDLALVSASIYLSSNATGDLYLLYFLAILAAALSRSVLWTLLAAAAISVVYLWVSAVTHGLYSVLDTVFLVRIPLFFVTSFFAAFLAAEARQRELQRREAQEAAAALERRLENTRRWERRALSQCNQVQHRLLDMLNRIDCAVISVDETGALDYLNEAAERMTGLEPDQVLGSNPSEIWGLESLGTLLHEARTQGRCATEIECPLDSQDRYRLTVSAAVAPLKDRNGKVTGAVASFRDLTEVKELEEQVQRLNRLAFLGEAAISLIEELRDPLKSTGAFAQLLLERTDKSDRFHQIAEGMLNELERMEGLMDQTMNFLTRDPGRLEPTDLNAVINSTVLQMQPTLAEHSVSVTRDLDPYLPFVLGNAVELRQLCANLILNAVQAIGQKGGLRISSHAEKGAVIVRFEDNGPGIPPELCENIFRPFFSTRSAGSGMGLPLSAAIAAEHGGTLRLVETSKHGTVFELSLPARTAAAEPESLDQTGTDG